MKKIDKTVLRETAYIAAGTLILTAVMNAVFVLIGKWDLTVLFGCLLGSAVAIGNFLLMGLTIQSAVGKDENTVRKKVRLSLFLRYVLMFGVAAGAYFLPSVFNIIPLLIAYFFPRFSLLFRTKIKLSGDEDVPLPPDSEPQDADDGDGAN